MTTGSTGSLGGNNYESRVWSGEDGKYEVVNGVKRTKFNNYTCAKRSLSSTAWNFPGGGTYYNSPADNAGLFDQNDTVKLQSKLASKVRGTNLHLGKLVVEGRQTVNMFRSTFLTVARAALNVKNGKVSEAAALLHNGLKSGPSYLRFEIMERLKKHKFRATDVAGRWLELQYGWLPLLQDIHSAVTKFNDDVVGARVSSLHASSSRVVRFEGSSSPSLFTCNGFATFVIKVKYEIAEEDSSISEQRKLGLEDPAGITWEAVPFSYLVDWALPIGSYLDSLNILPLLRGRWVQTKVRSVSVRNPRPTPLCYSIGVFGKGTMEWVSIDIERTHGEGFTVFDLALPEFKTLAEIFPDESTHVYNALALATQWLSGSKASRR